MIDGREMTAEVDGTVGRRCFLDQSHPCPLDPCEQHHHTNLSSFVSFWNSNKLHNSRVTKQAHVSLDAVTKEERVFIQIRTKGWLDGGGDDEASWFLW